MSERTVHGVPLSGQAPASEVVWVARQCQRGSVEHEVARAAPVALAMYQVSPGPPPTAAVW